MYVSLSFLYAYVCLIVICAYPKKHIRTSTSPTTEISRTFAPAHKTSMEYNIRVEVFYYLLAHTSSCKF